MDEALLKKLASDRFEVHSAGLEPTVIHLLIVRVLEEIGIDTREQYAKSLTEYIGKVHFGYLITVCSKAEERCPIFPGMGQCLHWPVDDPAAVEGSEQEKLTFFRATRDQIQAKIQEWLSDLES